MRDARAGHKSECKLEPTEHARTERVARVDGKGDEGGFSAGAGLMP